MVIPRYLLQPPALTTTSNGVHIKMSNDPTLLRVTNGLLRGTVKNDIRRFLGIPYAAPPVGDLRFNEPAPHDDWKGERDSTKWGPTAPQRQYDGDIGKLLHVKPIPGDSYLTANIWAPVGADDAPVVLWIHGGALERGAASEDVYDGTAFARDGVVFVSINYRLGTEGFAVLEGAPLNLGLKDCAAALAWVATEIGAVGGNPKRITVMGESAGAALAAALVCLRDSRPLIAGAIIQSAPTEVHNRYFAARVTKDLSHRMGIPPTAEAWRNMAPQDLVDARIEQAGGTTLLTPAPGFYLTEDEDLTAATDLLMREYDLPVLIGTNSDEYRLFLPPAAVESIGIVKFVAVSWFLGIPVKAIRAMHALMPEVSRGERLGHLIFDKIMRAPAAHLAAARPATTWMYEFAWPSLMRDLRAAHAVELGFTMDTLGSRAAAKLLGPEAPQSLADEMHGAWVKFIKTGSPGWEPYGELTAVRLFDTESKMVPLPRAAVIQAM